MRTLGDLKSLLVVDGSDTLLNELVTPSDPARPEATHKQELISRCDMGVLVKSSRNALGAEVDDGLTGLDLGNELGNDAGDDGRGGLVLGDAGGTTE